MEDFINHSGACEHGYISELIFYILLGKNNIFYLVYIEEKSVA